MIDDEILSAVFRIVRILGVNEMTVALELIKRIGIGGEHITEEHTAAHICEVT